MNWLLRSLLVNSRQRRHARAGFVLPTVAMVSLVVVLLTVALMLRSFDRSRNASNVRVNETVLNAAAPAIDRAKAKLDALFEDTNLPRATPSDLALGEVLVSNKYTFGDETRLKLVHDIDGSNTIQSTPNNPATDETLKNAWKFPVDTNNNGKFDSYTLYGVYFRAPNRNASGDQSRARSPLEARTPPMDDGAVGGFCDARGSASLVGGSDWYKVGSRLKKSFFVYTATVPIVAGDTNLTANAARYETLAGNKGFSALEFQQDRGRIPLNNNAVWYEDDIEATYGNTFRLNGRVHTNSNLMVAGLDGSNKVQFYQVSSPYSCYYDPENARIVVGGNFSNGGIDNPTDTTNAEVHLFRGKSNQPTVINLTAGDDKTITATGGATVAYNSRAYAERIGLMVDAALALHDANTPANAPPNYPNIASVSKAANRFPESEVVDEFKKRYDPARATEGRDLLTSILENYFRQITRRVPYAEVAVNGNALLQPGTTTPFTTANIFTGLTPIRPPKEWMLPVDPDTGAVANYTNLALKFDANTPRSLFLKATDPELIRQDQDRKENLLGDRILFGNNLPFRWPKFSGTTFAGFANKSELQPVKVNSTTNAFWNNAAGTGTTANQRTRQSRIETLDDLGDFSRNGFWEKAAAKAAEQATENNTGGLRVITGAGVYVDGLDPAGAGANKGTGRRSPTNTAFESFLPTPSLVSGLTQPSGSTLVWPDAMPMTLTSSDSRKGDLQMRATAVYHYAQGAAYRGANQVPIACVSSYYDPTDKVTARNLSGLPDVSGGLSNTGNGDIEILADGSTPAPAVNSNAGRSNNGVTYDAPYTNDTGRLTAVQGDYAARLARQANMIFPNGRWANEPLRKALAKVSGSQDRTLEDNAALDTAVCALKILDGTLAVQGTPNVPHGAIKEAAFLDGREIQAIHRLGTDNNRIAELRSDLTNAYNLPLEQREPLEIRVTEIDLSLLQGTAGRIGTPTVTAANNPANDREYLLPNTGIIFASRDDALPDFSASSDPSAEPTTRERLLSATDFKLDPSRRPNGIRLINGDDLSREDFYRIAEKGLILATNLPTYIRGPFNPHVKPTATGTTREEFTEALTASWDNFNSPAGKDRKTPNTAFACRTGQPGGCTDGGDRWRPATIISDAQTLISKDFKDGYRNQGDYDLRNNAGNSVVASRIRNGFWNNNFVASSLWWNTGNNDNTTYPEDKTTDSYVGSYLLNGVTPIQRRDNLPEYIMEICRKLPVSECRTTDWVVGYDSNGDGTFTAAEQNIKASAVPVTGFDKTRLIAGTTALPALAPEDRRYARRIAFQRNQYNTLLFTVPNTSTGKPAAKPYGVDCDSDNNSANGIDHVCIYPGPNARAGTTAVTTATQGITHPSPANNALWFRATGNTTGDPGTAADINYRNDRPLYYIPPTEGGGKLILPNTLCFTKTNVIDCDTTADPLTATTQFNLNLPRANVTNPAATDYLVCMKQANSNSGASDRYEATGNELQNGVACPTLTFNAIGNANSALAAMATAADAPRPTGTLTSAGGTLTAAQRLNFVEIGADFNNAVINLEAGGQTDPIFVFYKNNALNFDGTILNLNGVNPNNVFWAVGNARFNKGSSATTRMAGNFINSGTASPEIGDNVSIDGGRILGFNVAPAVGSNSKVTAVADDGQPLTVPILQVQSPEGHPDNTPASAFAGWLNDKWLQRASSTAADNIFNAAFVTGDSPSRPTGGTTFSQESGGGLLNFPRFLEAWEVSDGGALRAAKILGSFIQSRRSAYATAPFEATDPNKETLFFRDLTETFTGTVANGQPLYLQNLDNNLAEGYSYRGGASLRRAPFYRAPERAWGFDVALLTQSPDLFAQRFTTPPAGRPNEFYREVGRDDLWVKTLLCAAQGSGTNYAYAVGANERPADCKPITQYND